MEAHLIAFFQLSALEKYFAKGGHIDFSSFSTKTPNLKSQTNGSDCGFYMLLYMERFGRMKIDDINEVSVTPFIQLFN
jgi:Ulp1 family protease